MNPATQIKSKAHELGFELVGIVPAKPVPDFDFFRWWLDQGYAGTMNYLRRGVEKRGDPEKILPGVKSVICCGMNYFSGHRGDGKISSYAWGEDYHRILGERLCQLEEFIHSKIDSNAKTRSTVDTGAILERSYAARAGLGWIGKNTCLINNGIGSFFFLGEVLTTLQLDTDKPSLDQCGSCTKCLDACPTGALREPYVMDASRCISYLTIEYKGEFTGDQERMVGHHVYGCDICQEVCPYNDRIPTTPEPGFYPGEHFANSTLGSLGVLEQEEFERIRGRSPMERIHWDQWQRNLRSCRKNTHSSG